MKTLNLTAEQLETHIFRFGGPQKRFQHSGAPGIPAEAFAAVTPPLYLILAHATAATPAASRPAVVGDKGLSMAILELAPGQAAPLHVHRRSREVFMCLRGRVKFRLGDSAEAESILGVFDMIDVPVGVYRAFQCEGDEPALLLGIIADEREDEDGDVVIAPEERVRLVERFGEGILDKLAAATGMVFTDPAE